MSKLTFILTAAVLLASCSSEDPHSYKWREGWNEPVTPESPVDPSGPDTPQIQGKPRTVWVAAAANFQYDPHAAA